MDHLTKIVPDSSFLTGVAISQYMEVILLLWGLRDGGICIWYRIWRRKDLLKDILCMDCVPALQHVPFFAGCLVCYTETSVCRKMKWYYRTPWRGRGMVALYTAFFFFFFTEGVLMESISVTTRRTVWAGKTCDSKGSVCSTLQRLHSAGKARGW